MIAGVDSPFEVLVVDDNDNDVELMTIAFAKTRFDVNLTNVVNGSECLAFLRKQGKYTGAPTPDLVLLDSNMPLVDGFEVLEAAGQEPALKHLPIVIITSSEASSDIWKAWRLRCSSYMVKPIDFESFVRALSLLAEYWFTLVRLPTHAPAPSRATRVDR